MNTRRYTSNPNEVPTQTTVPSAADVVALLQVSWPELTRTGARTLTAQFLHETGGGHSCFNWNLGNVKATDTEPHMYLCGVWELFPNGPQAAAAVASGGRIAAEAECKQHGWAHAANQAVVVFDPPHPQSRFRAYANLADGAQRWMSLHRRVATAHPEYLPILNSGDCIGAAHVLKVAHYYSGDEHAYASSMTRILPEVPA